MFGTKISLYPTDIAQFTPTFNVIRIQIKTIDQA